MASIWFDGSVRIRVNHAFTPAEYKEFQVLKARYQALTDSELLALAVHAGLPVLKARADVNDTETAYDYDKEPQ